MQDESWRSAVGATGRHVGQRHISVYRAETNVLRGPLSTVAIGRSARAFVRILSSRHLRFRRR